MISMIAKIVTSTHDPDQLSIRRGDGHGYGGTFQRELRRVGFRDGDVVEVKLLKRTDDIVAERAR